MLTRKMNEVAQVIFRQIIKVFPKEYLRHTFSGKITINDVILQILVECCKYSYDNTLEKHSLDYYIRGSSFSDDSERMMHQRTMNYIRDKKAVQNQLLESEGWYVDGLVPEKMESIKDKLKGHSINSFQFWEICNVHDVRLVKAVVDKRIGKDNFTSKNMQELSEEYDSVLAKFQTDWNKNSTNGLFDFLAVFTLELKYSFDFYYEIADMMEKRNKTTIPKLKERVGLFSSPLVLYSDLLITHPGIIPGPMLAESRMLLTRRKYIEDIIGADEDTFKVIMGQIQEAIVITCAMLNQMTLYGEQIRKWFIQHTNQDDWLSVFKAYDVFQTINFRKEWSKKKTRYVKNIYNAMSLDYKNPEFRS